MITMNDRTQNQVNLFEEDDFYKAKPKSKKAYKRKPKNVNQLEEWIDDEIDENILRHMKHV
jgi:hypothetical protein